MSSVSPTQVLRILSIVIPAYNEEGNIRRLYDELIKVLPTLGMTWEIIFADDGSADKTWETIASLRQNDPRVRAVRLTRNFGHQYALLAGLQYACGDGVLSMDADLQHPPVVIPELVERWREGNKIVKAVRIDPEDISPFKRIASLCFYRLFSWLSGVNLERGMADFRLLDRRVLGDILRFQEEGLFLRGIVEWVGYRSVSVPYECGRRFTGSTKYTFRKMLRLGWNGVSSFSLVPLRIGVLIGFVASGMSFLGMLYAIYVKLIGGHAVPGWASSVAIISFLFGILFLFLGLLAEYVGRILLEVRRRPRFLIGETLGIDDAAAEGTEASR